MVVTVSEASCRIEAANSISNNPLSHHRPRYCDPHRNPVERVLVEIVDTEAIYVEHLRQVIQVSHFIFPPGKCSTNIFQIFNSTFTF